uniref:Large ribosomal subunit protein bL32c n=7 Tax=Pentapetalae TaxID=1437201 RepID=A0A6J3XAM8_9CARY|nr:ribosomal protein L32 [Silene kiusiana]AWX05973.1 ribosomal protein L32 [Silene kiusiana]
MAVPKKRTSISKKRIRKNLWKKKGYWAALKAFSLAKSLYTGNSTSFWEFKQFYCTKKKDSNLLVLKKRTPTFK